MQKCYNACPIVDVTTIDLADHVIDGNVCEDNDGIDDDDSLDVSSVGTCGDQGDDDHDDEANEPHNTSNTHNITNQFSTDLDFAYDDE
jgi:hypothetical protein